MGDFSISDQLKNQLEAKKQNVADSFKNGVDTCPFTPKNIVAQGQAQLQAVSGQAQQAWSNVTSGFQTTAEAWSNVDLQKQITEEVWDKYIKPDIENYKDEKVKEFTQRVASLTTYGAERTVYWTTYYLKPEIQKVVEDFYSNPITKAQQEAIKANTQAAKEKITDVLAKAQDIKNMVVDTTKAIYSEVTKITQVTSAGPDYVVKNVNKLYDKLVTPLKAQIDYQLDRAYEEALKKTDELANVAGKWIAQQTAEATKKATAKLLNAANKVKVIAISTAKTAISLVIQKIKGMTGG
jgi:hypothetical protein